LLTRGFADEDTRDGHIDRHGHEVGATSAEDYEAKADAFLGGPLDSNHLMGIDPQGDVVRADPATGWFAVMSSDNVIRTLYKPRLRQG
jgi:pyocin large subunit-like protein